MEDSRVGADCVRSQNLRNGLLRRDGTSRCPRCQAQARNCPHWILPPRQARAIPGSSPVFVSILPGLKLTMAPLPELVQAEVRWYPSRRALPRSRRSEAWSDPLFVCSASLREGIGSLWAERGGGARDLCYGLWDSLQSGVCNGRQAVAPKSVSRWSFGWLSPCFPPAAFALADLAAPVFQHDVRFPVRFPGGCKLAFPLSSPERPLDRFASFPVAAADDSSLCNSQRVALGSDGSVVSQAARQAAKRRPGETTRIKTETGEAAQGEFH